jgi:hypothetical protein
MAKLSESALNLVIEAVERIKYGSVTIHVNGDNHSDVHIEITESVKVKKEPCRPPISSPSVVRQG